MDAKKSYQSRSRSTFGDPVVRRNDQRRQPSGAHPRARQNREPTRSPLEPVATLAGQTSPMESRRQPGGKQAILPAAGLAIRMPVRVDDDGNQAGPRGLGGLASQTV
jgi:hypothetical protein